jgi:hypothetical protein
MFEQDKCDFIPTLWAHQQMSKVSGQIVDKPAIVKLADQYVIVPSFCSSIQVLLLNDE